MVSYSIYLFAGIAHGSTTLNQIRKRVVVGS